MILFRPVLRVGHPYTEAIDQSVPLRFRIDERQKFTHQSFLCQPYYHPVNQAESLIATLPRIPVFPLPQDGSLPMFQIHPGPFGKVPHLPNHHRLHPAHCRSRWAHSADGGSKKISNIGFGVTCWPCLASPQVLHPVSRKGRMITNNAIVIVRSSQLRSGSDTEWQGPHMESEPALHLV